MHEAVKILCEGGTSFHSTIYSVVKMIDEYQTEIQLKNRSKSHGQLMIKALSLIRSSRRVHLRCVMEDANEKRSSKYWTGRPDGKSYPPLCRIENISQQNYLQQLQTC